MRNSCKILLENLKGRVHLEDLGVDGRIVLKWVLQECGVRVWIGFIWLGVQLRTLVNTVMNLLLQQNSGIF